MKSTQIVAAVLVLVGCMMNGCTQDKLPTEAYIPEPPTTTAPTGSGLLTANIDGFSWAAEDIAGVPSGTSTYSENVIYISGIRAAVGDTGDTETIELIIDLRASNRFVGPGIYELGTIPMQEGEAQHSYGLTCICHTDNAQSGTVMITAFDVARKVVSGRFSFNGMGVNGQRHVITDGVFDVSWK